MTAETPAIAAAAAAAIAGVLAVVRGFGLVSLTLFGVVLVVALVVRAVVDVAVLDRRDFVLLAGVDLLDGREILVVAVVDAVEVVVLVVFFGSAQRGLFLGVRALFGKQRFAVGVRDLVVVGMDLAEGEEPVPVAAEVDESRLQRRFYTCYLGEIDVALDLLVFSRFEVEFLNPVALDDRPPRFFRVARIDQHARCHLIVSRRVRPPCSGP